MTPFHVEPQEIELLGSRFAEFVNVLLAAETARAGLRGEQLRTTSKTNVGDGGVDAHLVSSVATEWLPEGDTAWQFKAGDLGPADCRDELEGATWAQDLIRSGAAYRLVLGKDLTADRVDARRDELVDTALDLGLLGDRPVQGRIEVLAADSLARWTAQFPAISQSRLLRGIAPQVRPFGAWSASQRHQSSWISHPEREELIESIRTAISDGTDLDFRVAGPLGVGKTRLLMETLRDEALSPIVAYVRDAESFDPSAMAMLAGGEYHAILVVDDCTPRGHERLADQLQHDSDLRLVTIGMHQEDRGYPLRCPIWVVPGMPDGALDEFLKANHAGLSAEARRLVIDHVAGNVRYAGALAERVLEKDADAIAELIRSGDLSELLALEIPEGEDFFFAQALALVERFGYEGGLEHELQAIAAFADAPVERLRSLVQKLDERGLIEAQGRYRALAPDPLATYLAAHAWETWGARILDELVPSLDRGPRTSLFRRAASLGRYGPVSHHLVRLLEDPTLFGSLESIEEHDSSELLLHLAVIVPEETVRHLSSAVAAIPVEELRGLRRSRRNLVWALEKLAWHSSTFERAANVLLKLALAENESFANNATGVWVSLFGTMLPATAATPVTRLRYIQDKRTSPNAKVRLLVVQACKAGMQAHESVTVSGELQGGTVVESRGIPSTWGEAADYRIGLAEILRELSDDPVEDVATAALQALVSTIHPFADDELVWPRLKPLLLSLRDDQLSAVREEADELVRLHERVRGDEEEYRRPGLIASLSDLRSELPPPTRREALQALAGRRPWDLSEDDAARQELDEAVLDKAETDGVPALVQWLIEEQPPSGWYVGRSLAELPERGTVLSELTDGLPSTELPLAGFLAGADEDAEASAFDDFLDEGPGTDIDPELRLRLTVRGPVTAAAIERVATLVSSESVASTARVLAPWAGQLPDETCVRLLRAWIGGISRQDAYNAVLDWAALWLHRKDEAPAEAVSPLEDLVHLRRDFPEVGQESWDWCQLASHVLRSDPVGVAELILDLVSSGHLMLPHHEEARLLENAADTEPAAVWGLVSERLEAGDWRVEMSLSGFFLHSIPLDVIRAWVGDSVSRAEQVAAIAPVGGASPSPYAEYLLTEFGESERVAGALAGEFSSGSWSGPWSSRIRNQIDQMDSWLDEESHSTGVNEWARRMKQSLEEQLQEALQREAEELR